MVHYNLGEGGNMYDLAAIKNLNIKKENYPARKKDLPQSIWDKSEVPNHSDSKSFQLAKSYFTKHRKISYMVRVFTHVKKRIYSTSYAGLSCKA